VLRAMHLGTGHFFCLWIFSLVLKAASFLSTGYLCVRCVQSSIDLNARIIFLQISSIYCSGKFFS
jgi:hypothetical protein